MGYINRFLLFLYALVIAVAALGVAALCLHVLPESVIQNELKFLLTRWETIAGSVVAFLWSVHLMGCALSRDASGDGMAEAVLVHSEAGDVRVAVPAVRDLLEKSALRVQSVREATAHVRAFLRNNEPAIEIRMDLAADGKESVVTMSDAVRTAVGQQLTDVLGMTAYTLELSVSDFVAARDAAHKRVN